ncbi:hypothetical protein QYE76_054873 [Lolium multiflorum]|uniref:Uncharacterized protein n=1 Tax=Lolium multiflorum TaxID=4521 RepID=A0AAD8WLE4_LOLMU|nr:hypothetical protein QYE76_054873 [Lolium multiflorum]
MACLRGIPLDENTAPPGRRGFPGNVRESSKRKPAEARERRARVSRPKQARGAFPCGSRQWTDFGGRSKNAYATAYGYSKKGVAYLGVAPVSKALHMSPAWIQVGLAGASVAPLRVAPQCVVP